MAAPRTAVALDVVSDIFMNAKLEQEEITREAGPSSRNSVCTKICRCGTSTTFGIASVRRSPARLGNYRDAGKHPVFQAADFVRYMKRGYVAENVVVREAGNFDMKRMRKGYRSAVRSYREHGANRRKKASDTQSVPGLFIQKKKTDQTHMLLGVRTFDMFHPDRYALSVLATLLGGGMSSRLFIEVRERRGLAYSVLTSVEAYRDAGISRLNVRRRTWES